MDNQSRVVTYTQEPLRGLGIRAALDGTPFVPQAVFNHIEDVPQAAPTVILYDAANDTTWAQLRQLRAALPHVFVVVLVANFTTAHAEPLREMRIEGVIRRDATVADLTACLERVSRGLHWVDASFEPLVQLSRRSRLTPREVELVRLVASGLSNKEIASALGITEGTVKGNLSKVFRKVGVDDRLELAMHGVRHLGLSGSA